MQFPQHRDSHYRIGTVCQDQVRLADGVGQFQQVPDLAAGGWFPGRGELWQIASHPQGIEVAQVIDVRPYAVEDPVLPHVVQRWPHGVRVGDCIFLCSGRSQIIVSLVTQPVMPLAILS